MKDTSPNLQIRIHGIDGSIQTFFQIDPDLVNRTLNELNPARIFTEDRIVITDKHSVATFFPPLITRLDLITDRLSVWDFPFVIGALEELTEEEFMECCRRLQRREQARSGGDSRVFLDIEMVSGQRAFLWMKIIAGLPAERLLRIYSLFKERRLIFGLCTGGIGVLNLANMVHFEVHPEPPEATIVAGSVRHDNSRQRRSLIENRSHHRTVNGKPHFIHARRNNQITLEPRDGEEAASETNVQGKHL
jgi:hypothetical protein